MKLTTTLAAVALLAPSALFAQTRPRWEFGVDAGMAYYSQGDREVGAGLEVDGNSGVRIGTPVDVRIGIVGPGALTFEPRFGLSFTSVSDAGSLLFFSPTLNVLYQPGKRALVQRGMYYTAGVGFDVQRFRDEASDDSETATQPTINVGVGTRTSINQGAFRPEAFLAYSFETDEAPSEIAIGVRLGLSFWK